MGIWTSAYLAYGFPIDDHDEEHLDQVLRNYHGIGHLSAGPYDQDRLYLVAQCESAELGTPATVTLPTSPDTLADWDQKLAAASEALGITKHEPPGWRLIAAQS